VAAKDELSEVLEWNDLLQPAAELHIQDPQREATQALMIFFTDDCGLQDSDAHQRTGEIFTQFRWRDSLTDLDQSVRLEKEAVRKRHARAKRNR
jgi:hypothetical protein